jgi:DNA mismatch repair protein MutL
MSSVKVLPDNLINKIAAGEVVERPASVVKELIENSLDAGASEVFVDIEKAGKRLIRITDNGRGMNREDAALAFERHATSKVRTEADLEEIRTFGFRGEALASIASVSQVRMLTAELGASSGALIEIDGGSRKAPAEAASPPGTSIEVRHLFFNTPARLKFLKSDATELSHIISAVSRQALAHPGIRFRLTHDGKTIFELPQGFLRERVFHIFGSELAEGLMAFEGSREPAAVHGLIGRPGTDRGDRTYQEFYVNGRYIKNASLTHALYEAYRDLVMRDRHPVGFVFLDIDPDQVDVNVHPAKAEVRFRSQSQVHDLVRDVIREALRGSEAAADTPVATGGPAGRVQESVAGYLAAASGRFPEPYLFGRRRSDLTAPLSGHQAAVEPVAEAPEQIPAPLPELSPEQLIPLCQVHDSFIIAQSASGMAIIDQHAAHERVLFERLQDQYASGSIPVQDLLLPLTLELGHAERGLLIELLPGMQRLGFHVEAFGGGTFVIKAVPALMAGGDHRRLALDILDEVRAHGGSRQADKQRDDLLSVMACHPAIKVHRKLTLPEMEELLRDLASCRMPHSCPHGRPTVVRFSMDEIKRMFKRI